jgi:hypothetical protein
MTVMLWNLALCLALALFVWAPLGYWVLRRALGEGSPAGPSVSAAVGLGFWGLWVLLLGVLGALYVPVLLVSVAAGAVLLRFYPGRRPGALPPRDVSALPLYPTRVLIAAFALLSAIYMVIVAASALAPELSFDALNVHLPYARDAADSHHIVFAPNNWSSAMPALPLMSYVTGFLFSGVILAKLFNTLCYVLTGGVIYYFCRRWGSPLHGIVAAALFWSSPTALYEATTALIDLPFVLYSGLAVLSLLEWTRKDEDTFLWLSAVSLGFALGCKYHATFWFLPFALVITWHLVAARNNKARALTPILLRYALIVCLLFLPWMLRTWLYTGNPVFPLANGIFKSPYFTPAMERASWAAFANEGVGRSWQALLTLPWTVTFHPGPFRGTLGVGFFFGILLALLRPKTLQQRYGLVMAGIYFYTWGLVAQEIRYLLPLAPLLAMVSSFGILGAGRSPSEGEKALAAGKRPSLLRHADQVAGCLALLAAAVLSFPSLYPSWVKEWTYWHSYKPPWRYLLGRESAQEYLQRDVPSIYVYDFLNEKLTPQDRVLLLNDHAQFYSRVPTLYSFTLEGEGILLQDTEEGVLKKLRAARITHVLLNYNGIAPLPGVQPRLGAYFFLDKGFLARNLEPVYSKNNVVLYRVLD